MFAAPPTVEGLATQPIGFDLGKNEVHRAPSHRKVDVDWIATQSCLRRQVGGSKSAGGAFPERLGLTKPGMAFVAAPRTGGSASKA